MVERLHYGILVQRNHIVSAYTRVNFILLFVVVAAAFSLLNWDSFQRLLRTYFYIFLFFGFYVLGYSLLFSWYAPVAGGPRFLYGLFIPFVFSVYWLIQKLGSAELRVLFYNPPLIMRVYTSAFDILLFALLMAQIYQVIVLELPNGYFGS